MATQVQEMLDLAYASFAPATSKYATRDATQANRKKLQRAGEDGIGLDEFAGVLMKGRMI